MALARLEVRPRDLSRSQLAFRLRQARRILRKARNRLERRNLASQEGGFDRKRAVDCDTPVDFAQCIALIPHPVDECLRPLTRTTRDLKNPFSLCFRGVSLMQPEPRLQDRV